MTASIEPTAKPAATESSSIPTSQKFGLPIAEIPKTWSFTQYLPPDPLFPTPESSHSTPRGHFMPRTVKGALYTYIRPVTAKDPELLATSPAALADLNISDPESDTFRNTVAGNVLHGWDEEKKIGGYPWAQCYGGFQFGSWAGQLGDGRAISLFETTPPTKEDPQEEKRRIRNDYNLPSVPLRYELQLKGAGLTPYSRFADGKAVLRSSIREFIVSEYLHALGIPTTRALSLTLLPHEKVIREQAEPGAIVCRFAQSWLRLGTFDLLRARGERKLTRQLATYIAEQVFGGWENLPSRLPEINEHTSMNPDRGVGKQQIQGPAGEEENRFTRLYREIVRRNAVTVARWQAYGFMNGVLNTDNTSIYGLSIDFGPFAFMDAFDPNYTPNHDDYLLRYSFRNQPTIIWWNLVRLGEALGELIGAGLDIDGDNFVQEGVQSEEEGEELVKRAELLIHRVGEEYKATFMAEYKRLMTRRLGLKQHKDGDFGTLYSEALDILELGGLDFHFFFRRLGKFELDELQTEEDAKKLVERFFYGDGITNANKETEVRKRMGAWLMLWKQRIIEDWGDDHGIVPEEMEMERKEMMRMTNPNFVPRGWVLDEIIKRVEKNGERDVLKRVVYMSLNPFEEQWTGRGDYEGDEEEERRWVSDVSSVRRAMQCSCSS